MGSMGLSTKLMLFTVLACALWFGGKRLAMSGAVSHEALGRVVWMGDASYDASTPGVGMRAGMKRHITQTGVHVLLDGGAEPLELTDRGGSQLRQLTEGDRVRVAYRESGWLLWHEVSLTRIEKL